VDLGALGALSGSRSFGRQNFRSIRTLACREATTKYGNLKKVQIVFS